MKQMLLAIATATLFASCGQSLPTEGMALQKLNDDIKPTDKGLVEYQGLKKSNGTETETNGTKFYQMDFSVNLVAKQDIHKCYTGYIADTSIAYVQSKSKPNPMIFNDSWKKGQVIQTLNSNISFAKGSNGWTGSSAL